MMINTVCVIDLLEIGNKKRNKRKEKKENENESQNDKRKRKYNKWVDPREEAVETKLLFLDIVSMARPFR